MEKTTTPTKVSSRAKAQKFYKELLDTSYAFSKLVLTGHESSVRALMAVKRESKKSWEILGVPDDHGARIATKMKDLES